MSHEYHFVGMNFGQQPIHSSPSRPMLRNECDGKRSLNFGWPRFLDQPQDRQQCGSISGRLAADFLSADSKQISLHGDCVQYVYSRRTNLSRALRSHVHEQFIRMIHLRAAGSPGLQVNAQSREHAVDLFSAARHYPHRLREIQHIEHRSHRSLRQTLHAQISVFADSADHVSWFIHGHGDQLVWRPRSNRDVNISQIVGLRLLRFHSVAKRSAQPLLMPGYRNRKCGNRRFSWLSCLLACCQPARNQQRSTDQQRPNHHLFRHPTPPRVHVPSFAPKLHEFSPSVGALANPSFMRCSSRSRHSTRLQ